MHFWQEYSRSDCILWKHMMSIYSLMELLSFFLQGLSIVKLGFPLDNKYLRGRYFGTIQIPCYSSNLHPFIVCLNQLIFHCLCFSISWHSLRAFLYSYLFMYVHILISMNLTDSFLSIGVSMLRLSDCLLVLTSPSSFTLVPVLFFFLTYAHHFLSTPFLVDKTFPRHSWNQPFLQAACIVSSSSRYL